MRLETSQCNTKTTNHNLDWLQTSTLPTCTNKQKTQTNILQAQLLTAKHCLLEIPGVCLATIGLDAALS